MGAVSSFDELFNTGEESLSGALPSLDDLLEGSAGGGETSSVVDDDASGVDVESGDVLGLGELDDTVSDSVEAFASMFLNFDKDERHSDGSFGEEGEADEGGRERLSEVLSAGGEVGFDGEPSVGFLSEVVSEGSEVAFSDGGEGGEEAGGLVFEGISEDFLEESLNDLDAILSGELEVGFDGDEGEDEWANVEGAFDSDYDEDDEDAVAARNFNIDRIISAAIDVGASDVHIYANDEIIFRILGQQVRQPQFGVVTPQLTDQLADRVTGHRERESLVIERFLDTSYVVKMGPNAGRRTRLSVGHEDERRYFVFRIIADQIKTIEELGVPSELVEWTKLNSGLVMMNGPTGSGKSTTLASLVQEMLNTRPHHIITLEKPIEYMFTPSVGTVVQRNVGSDARSFKEGLTAAMRGDPDIIMVGEVRNRVEVDALLEATETGHLAISTMHTNSASGAIDRIVSMYSGDELKSTMGVLSSVSRGFANQLLLLSPDGKSRVAVREILTVTNEVKDLIEQGNSRGIYQYQWDRGITMEHELIKAVESGAVSLDTARYKCNDPLAFNQLANDLKRFL